MNDLASSPAFRRALQNELMRRSLGDFHRAAFGMLHSGEHPVMGLHTEAMIHALTRLARGEIKRLIITLPPRHGKSELVSGSYASWLLGHDPSAKVTVASYGMELSEPLVQLSRKIIRHPRYQRLFPGTTVVGRRDRSGYFATTAEGSVRAASRNGAMTGLGTHYLIVDDWMKTAEILSAVEREKAIETFRSTFLTRFDNLVDGRIVIVQQRLHEEDLVGWALEHGDWHHLNLPGIAVQDQEIQLPRGRAWHRKRGDLLCPALASQEVYDFWRNTMTSGDYEAQIQQDPGSAGGGHVDWGWFGSYQESPPRNFFEKVVQSIDAAASDASSKGSWSVGMTWGYRDPYWYLLDLFRVKDNLDELLDRVLSWHRRWEADALVIEYASNGIPLYQFVKAARLPGILRAPQPTLSKTVRLDAAAVHLRTGKFLLPASAEWLPALRRELLGFPNASSDDQVDALSQFIGFVFESRGWVETKYNADGRRLTVKRCERKPRYYGGDVPSAGSWRDKGEDK